ncbi:filamentous hemagglutinin N-terminal domain-containing protein [Phascolarctobacterium succinatutens]
MKQKDNLNKRLNTRLASLVMLSVLSVPWVASAAGDSVVANNMLPGNGKKGDVIAGNIEGGFDGSWAQGNQMLLHQKTQNAIVTWDSFSIGANATVTIRGDHDNFNMLNYVTGSESSQIYGKLNSYVGDKQGGNIYLVNPNGVQIGNSAEINVGSLHIANKKIDNINRWNENTDIANALKQNKAMTNAELMSLGYINANKLVFEGERVVIDMDRLSGLDTTKADALTIVSKPYDDKSFGDNRKYDVVLGSSTPENAKKWGEYIEFADNGTGDRWQGTVQAGNPDAPNQSVTEFFTYRWIKDGKELENIGKKQDWGMGDHYALRYSIDLTGSNQTPIGNTQDNAFKGKFDGLDNSIFGLSINNSDNSKGKATGLFGFTDGAIMGNVTLIAGNDGVSIQGGNTDTGAFIGHAVNTTVKGVNSTLKVSGTNNVGGIIGYAEGDRKLTYNFADAAGSVQPDSRSSELSNLTNTGNVSGVSNVGGLVGYMNGGKLSNDEENRVQYKGSYNLGKITGIDNGSNYSYNIGGMIGKAENATVGGTKNTLINYNTVEGGYNVGGIVGSISNNTTVANASNEGVVKANGFTTDYYIYHTDYTGNSWQNNNGALPGTHKAEVRAANVGGIVGSSAGSELKDVTNKADVSSALVKKTTGKNDPTGFDHYAAGNVGGIVGRAEDSNITNANNVESNIRGAMNVGGIAGYFGSTDATNKNKKDYRILNAINNGGDIMATGGIKKDGSFTQEITHKETYITGNIGGIAGYLYGVPVRIEAGGNRGDVHTAADTSKRTSQAVNVGGIVGKIDMPKKTDSDGNRLTDDNRLAIIKGNATDAAGKSGYASAAVSSSYNTGNVTGYTNIGGIGGFAYNGSIAASYNVGDIKTTRHDAASTGVTPINMGGILGESTEMAIGRVIIYDTYNKGTIGDSSYTTYGRHVGGIVGRLSGIVEKSYNNGDIYNGFNVVGGIAGYWYSGYLKNVFNTGNITVYNKNDAPSQVGGIVGSVDLSGGNQSSGTNAALSISNAYNLGSLRSFMGGNKYNEVGGILGGTFNWSGTSNKLKISNAYTMGNIYVDKLYSAGGFVGDIVGAFDRGTNSSFVAFENVYYIRPQENNGYFDLASAPTSGYLQKNAKVINYNELTDMSKWGDFGFSTQTNGKIEGATDDNWRMSNGASLPMLNAFLSGSHKYFSDDSNWQAFMKDNDGANVQYGTAYDPLLTIINTKKDLSFNWSDMDLKNNGSLAVFGLHDNGTNLNYTPGLTLNNVEITNSTHIFGGTIYSDGLLELNAKDNLQDGLRFGMDSKLYGSDVVLNTNSSMELSGSVIATGNHNVLSHFNPEKSLQHGINITSSDLTVYGKLITLGKDGESTEVIVPGINYGYGDSLALDKANVSDKTKAMTSQGINHAYRLQTATAKTGNITISTMEKTLTDGTHMNGSANLLYGNYKKGKIETKGKLTVSSSGDILVDSDLDIAGSINLRGNGSGSNITLDLSNIGSELKGNEKIKAIHAFIDAHATEATGIYGNTAGKRPMKITFDIWDDNYEVGDVTGNLNYTKYDLTKDDGTTNTLIDKLKSLYVESAGTTYKGDNIRNVIYAWISNEQELNSLQRVAESLTDRDALSYNFVMKNDIDASGLVDAEGNSTYNTIGGGTTAFTGTFDGDGHTIVGLQAKGGIFGKLGSGAVVKNINIASSVFTGNNTYDSVGAVAAENNGGSISGISGYGNTIKGSGGYIGGLVGKNYGGISNSNDHSTVIAGAGTVAGGIAGVNGTNAGIGGTIDNVQSNSAVTTGVLAKDQYAYNLGGIVGKNELLLDKYNINNVSAHGVTGKTGNTQTSGGIVGTNEGRISNAYNESIIHGSKNIGGVAGKNVTQTSNSKMAELNDVANAVEIIGDAGSQNVGGLVGMQNHATANQGRNTGAITGCTNVGGMVGYNTADSYLNNLENSPQATITGITNVGGIAGVNEGEISADDQMNLVNSGEIYGWENVGGIAGKNSGKIDNVNSNINLYVIDEATRTALKGSTAIADNAQFFGGVTGENVGIITNATNRARVDAAQASYVGGIVGRNTSEGEKVGQLLGMGNSNEGFVIGKNYVGGVIGKNEVAITGTADESVGIVNSGTVIAKAGGAGGIIGENSADITHVIMKNEGEVHGNASIKGSKEENGTGGIIGVNGYKADGTGATISNSSLMNRVDGNVSGVANVGGIIGINHGVITGGRDANNNYYKYQIYNNSTIQAGSYNAETGTITAVDGENIGGLLGNNSGTLTAGYNTGVVDAGQSSNVGGIAGTNSGKLDQVFNSVVTVTKTETGETDADGKKLYNYTYTDGGEIRGAGNVGGIVGSNTAEGVLSNAYSTTAVAGSSNVANIVGSNAGQVSNIYGYKANGNTNVNGGNVRNSHIINADGTLENGKDAKKLDSYAFEDKDTIWKLYDKRTNPLLKVFLTKVTVAGDLQNGWVYDATNHLDIPGWIENGKLTTNDAANDAFAAYKNNNSLLQGENLKNVGTYSSWLWSGQIASGGEVGPNNLGYDFTVDDITITKKVLNVIGNTVNRTYGSLLKDHDYALSIDGLDSFNDAMKAELDGKVTITDSQDTIQNNQDTGIITVDSEKRTNNKDSYSWQAGVKLDDSLTGNYEFIDNGVSSTTTTVHGVSNVLARKVYLNDINANLTYGSSDAINDHINGVVSIKDLASAIVYGDNVKLADGAVVNVKDGSEYAVNKGERNTADVDTYDNSLKIDNAALTGDARKLGNYELVNDATGSIKVDQAEMHVKLNDVERTYGNTALINGTSYGVNGLTGNVNGDNYGAGDVTLGTASDGALTGNSTGRVTNDADDTYKWNANVVAANDKLKQNYKLVVDDGASVVNQATLQVSLNDVVRTYGNAAITSGSYSASGIEGLVNGDSYDASAITVNKTSDGALTSNTEGRVTNDYGNYIWSGDLTTDNAALKNNYKLELKEDGVSKVGKATLNVGLSDVYRTYGNATITSGGYSAGNITGLVNGDSYNANDFKVTVNSDGAIAGVTGDRVTNDHGEYTWNGTIEAANAGLNKNYDLVVNANGKSYVDKAILNVGLNDVVRTYGNTSFTDGTDYGIKDHDALVNSDKGTVSLNKDAITDGGLVDNNSKTNNKGDYKWTVGENGIVADGVTNFAKNYDIKVTAGNSKVNAKKIYLNNINASTTYGSKEGLKADGNVSLQDNSIVYGDKVSLKDGASVSYKADGEYAANKGDRDTADAGTYKADVAVTGAELVGNELGNYELVNNATGVITVKKAILNVGLNDVVRTYGDTSFTDGTGYGIKNHDALVNGDKGTVSLNKDAITDGGLVDNNSKTNNKGDYKWNVGENGIVAENVANFAKNYDIQVTAGNSKVNAKKIYLNNINASTTYGSKEGLKADGNVSLQDNSIVYGDKVSLKDGASVSYKADGEYVANKGDRDTADAGTYKADVAVTGAELVGNELGNYELVNNATGVITVKKATLNVGLNDVVRTYGDTSFTDGTGYGIKDHDALVNGDKGTVSLNKDAITDGGLVDNNSKTNNKGDYKWNVGENGIVADGVTNFAKNYDIQVTAGNSKVNAKKIYLNNINASTTYGSKEGLKADGNVSLQDNSIVYGDQVSLKDGASVSYKADGEYAANKGDRDTADAGTYKADVAVTGEELVGNELGNYELVNNATGVITVKKAILNVGLNDVVRTYGDTSFTDGTGYGIKDHDALVNGDKGTVSLNKDAITDGGLVDNNSKTNNKGDYNWNVGENGIVAENVANFAKNYDIKVTAGNSKVNAKKIYLNNINASTTYGSKDGLRVDGNVSLQDNSIVYGDKVSLKDGASVSYKADGEYAANKGDRDTADAGTYKADVAVTGAELVGNELGNYELVNNATGVITVKKATLNVGLNDVVRTYGNATITSGGYSAGNITGLVNGDNYGASDFKVTVNSDGAIAGVTGDRVTNDHGEYTWNGTIETANAGLNKNYDLVVNGNGKSTVKKANLVVNLNDITRVYGNLDAKNYSNAFTFGNNAGLVNGDSGLVINADKDGAIAEGSVSDVKKTNNVGSYEWNGTASGVENLNTNYDVQINAGKSDVTKASLVVNLNDITRVYGNLDAKNYSNAFTFGANAGLVNGDNGLVINADKDGAIAGGTLTNVEKTNNVGSYEWNGTASGVDNLNTNYDVQINAGKSDVTKANLVVNLNDITRVYGNLEAKDYSKAFTFGANAGLVNGDNGLVINADKDGAIAGGTLTNVEKTNNVGNYEWNGTASGVDNLNTNYDVQINAGKSDVTKANLVVNLNDITRVYGNLDAKNYSNAFTFGANAGLVNGDNGLVINADKDGAIAGGTLTNVEKTNNVGSYKWNGTASGVENLNTNYDVQINAGKSDVTKANLVVNLNDITRVYGNLDAKNYSNAFTFGANAGLVNGDSGLVINADKDGAIAEGSLTDVKKTNNVGSYEWNGTVSGVDNLNTNYDVTVNAGKSDVTKANLVVNLNDITRVYGNLDAKDYSNAYTFSANAGLVNGDNGLVINANKDGAIAEGSLTDVKKTNNVGSYEWNGTASGVDNLNTNYDVTVNAGKSDVTKANLVVNLNDITRVYGNLDAKDYSNAYTFGNNAGLVNGDNGLVINADKDGAIAGGTLSNVEKTNNVGNYEWNGTASGVENLNTNYNVQINAGKSDVTKANIVVNLNDISRVYGNLDAKDYSNAYTFGANAGLVNGDNGLVIKADKDGAIVGGTLSNVEKTNNVGSYEWNGTASGVENLNHNYNVTVNAGKSDVTKANLTFVVDDKTIHQGVPTEYTGTASGLTNGDTLAGIGVGGYELDNSVNPLIVGVYEDKIGVLINGSVHLTGSDGLLKNYKVEIDPGTLTVLASFNPADDYWFGTAPWDKERNLRERKAEFHYVAGGMSI